ncbi:hypothetical protein LZ554_008379 [Drepanopeziza brunnea f. sp. 'monogermtubi']|nr:hypothetical protein LZ554_008379 [Drepanopeziza brunnea f. sp. 'monogermtubi']
MASGTSFGNSGAVKAITGPMIGFSLTKQEPWVRDFLDIYQQTKRVFHVNNTQSTGAQETSRARSLQSSSPVLAITFDSLFILRRRKLPRADRCNDAIELMVYRWFLLEGVYLCLVRS